MAESSPVRSPGAEALGSREAARKHPHVSYVSRQVSKLQLVKLPGAWQQGSEFDHQGSEVISWGLLN